MLQEEQERKHRFYFNWSLILKTKSCYLLVTGGKQSQLLVLGLRLEFDNIADRTNNVPLTVIYC